MERSAQINEIIHAIGPMPLEVMRIDGLHLRILLVQIRGKPIVEHGDAPFEFLAPAIHRTEHRIDRAMVCIYGAEHLGTERFQVVKYYFHFITDEIKRR